jgi:hypothetical protein
MLWAALGAFAVQQSWHVRGRARVTAPPVPSLVIDSAIQGLVDQVLSPEDSASREDRKKLWKEKSKAAASQWQASFAGSQQLGFRSRVGAAFAGPPGLFLPMAMAHMRGRPGDCLCMRMLLLRQMSVVPMLDPIVYYPRHVQSHAYHGTQTQWKICATNRGRGRAKLKMYRRRTHPLWCDAMQVSMCLLLCLLLTLHRGGRRASWQPTNHMTTSSSWSRTCCVPAGRAESCLVLVTLLRL